MKTRLYFLFFSVVFLTGCLNNINKIVEPTFEVEQLIEDDLFYVLKDKFPPAITELSLNKKHVVSSEIENRLRTAGYVILGGDSDKNIFYVNHHFDEETGFYYGVLGVGYFVSTRKYTFDSNGLTVLGEALRKVSNE